MTPQLSFLFFPFSYIREDCRIFTRIITCFVFCDDCFRAFNVMILNISSLQSHITTSLMPIIHLYFFSLLSCIYCISITLNSFLPSFLPSFLLTCPPYSSVYYFSLPPSFSDFSSPVLLTFLSFFHLCHTFAPVPFIPLFSFIFKHPPTFFLLFLHLPSLLPSVLIFFTLSVIVFQI